MLNVQMYVGAVFVHGLHINNVIKDTSFHAFVILP